MGLLSGDGAGRVGTGDCTRRRPARKGAGGRAGGSLTDDFLASVQELLDRLVENPRLYQELEQGIRRALTRRFPYALFYLLENERIIVLAALHQSRDPSTGESRI